MRYRLVSRVSFSLALAQAANSGYYMKWQFWMSKDHCRK